jgi:hypothetical protein
MKRKVKKYAEGDLVEKEGKGFFGETQKWKEDKEGRKFTDSGNRYYSADDVKGKLSGLFGGKKEEAKYDDSKSVGDANKSSSYYKSEEEPHRQMTDRMTNKPEPAGKTFLREEADIDYKSEKKAAPTPRKVDSKIEAAAPAPKKAKASMDAGIPKDTKSTRMPSGYDKLDVSEKPSVGKSSTAYTRAGTAVKSSNEPNAEDVAAANKKFVEKMKKQNKENEATFKRIGDVFSSKNPNRSYKSGGSVRSSASKRADGCAIRGKTRA